MPALPSPPFMLMHPLVPHYEQREHHVRYEDERPPTLYEYLPPGHHFVPLPAYEAAPPMPYLTYGPPPNEPYPYPPRHPDEY
jgi:hypothetical protein